MDIEIIKETQDFLALNKPAGVAVCRSPKLAGQGEPTVTGWLLQNYPEVQGVGESQERPGIVHRLDKGTSGVLVVARNQAAYEFLKAQFVARAVVKEYLALVWTASAKGFGESRGVIEVPLTRSKRGGFRWRVAKPHDKNQRPAITEWQVEKRSKDWTLLRLWPKTGRTHQLRVHLAHIGYPIAGDPVYAFKNQPVPAGLKRIFLHAAALRLVLPGESKPRRFEAPLPGELNSVLFILKAK